MSHEFDYSRGIQIGHLHSKPEFAVTELSRGPAVDSQALRAGALSASMAATSVNGLAVGRGNGAEIG